MARTTKRKSGSRQIADAAVVDVFCGVGGLSHGFRQVGFDVVAGIDADASCKHAFEVNNQSKFYDWRVEKIEPDRLQQFFGKARTRILVGCAPCQPFSTYSQRYDVADSWWWLNAFADLIVRVQPDIVSMENVVRLGKFGSSKVFRNLPTIN